MLHILTLYYLSDYGIFVTNKICIWAANKSYPIKWLKNYFNNVHKVYIFYRRMLFVIYPIYKHRIIYRVDIHS